jgi:hypothetical protein
VRNKVIKEKIGVKQTILERMENFTLRWCGRALRMGDNRWPEQRKEQREGEDRKCSGKGSEKQVRTQGGWAAGLQPSPPNPQNRNLKNRFCRYYIKRFT